MRIAFLGLGRMGRELAAHLLADGHELTVWNRTPAATARLSAAGAQTTGEPGDAVAGAQAVVTALFGADAVRETVLARDLALDPGAVWIETTTISPAEADEFAAWAAARPVGYVHAPVMGSIPQARARRLGSALGGSPDAVAAAEPVVRTWAVPERLRTYPSARQAATDKLLNNLALAAAAEGLIEALRLGHSAGLETEQVLAALDGSMLAAFKDFRGADIAAGRFEQTLLSARLMAKDLRLMTHTSSYPLPAVTALAAALHTAIGDGRGEHDFTVVAAPDRARTPQPGGEPRPTRSFERPARP